MKRTSVALGILGLVWPAAIPASAQTTIQLFGKTYNVVKESRGQTYNSATGRVQIVLPPRDASLQLASLDFVEGADASKDRMFVGINIVADESVTADQFYLLTG